MSGPGDVFVAPASGDLHLKTAVPEIVGRAQAVPDAPHDIDGQDRPQGAGPDIGADEWLER